MEEYHNDKLHISIGTLSIREQISKTQIIQNFELPDPYINILKFFRKKKIIERYVYLQQIPIIFKKCIQIKSLLHLIKKIKINEPTPLEKFLNKHKRRNLVINSFSLDTRLIKLM